MSNLPRTYRTTLLTLALAAGFLASAHASTPVAPYAKAESPRKTIESMAMSFQVPAGKISYIGLDRKPITAAAFYQALESNPSQKWEGSGTIAKSSQKANVPNEFEARLLRADK